MNASDYVQLYQNLVANGYTGTMEELMQQILSDRDPHAVDQNIGMVTAYAYAVSKGFVGTEDDFAQLLADFADAAQRAEQAAKEAETAKTDAEAAKTGAQRAASAAAESATEAGNAKTDAEDAKTGAQRAASAAAESATEAGNAKTDAEDAKTEARRAASAAADSSTAAAKSAALATSVVNLTDKDDENKLYAMAWSVENGFPVLTLTERT